ncbi:MAG TPA: hypothetical protein VK667_10860, partial [Ktedonobacteraceae bacterium]|nr:hypothetical protein [Ktedonobacteraceae bacterium]
LCERIAIMDHGRILALDTPAGLKKLIPGGNVLELRVLVPERVLAGSTFSARTDPTGAILDVLRSLPGVSQVEEVPVSSHEGETTNSLYRIYAEDVQPLVGQATRLLVKAGADLQDLQLIKPSLEDVFIYLTGRNLRA